MTNPLRIIGVAGSGDCWDCGHSEYQHKAEEPGFGKALVCNVTGCGCTVFKPITAARSDQS